MEELWFFKWKSESCAWKNGEMHVVNKVNLIEGNIVYLFSIADIKNYHKLCGLSQHNFIISQFCRSEDWNSSHLAKIRALIGLLHSFLKALGKGTLFPCSFSGGQNSVSCCCKTEVPIFFLTFSIGPFPTSGGCHHFLTQDSVSSSSKPTTDIWICLMLCIYSAFSSVFSLPNFIWEWFFAFKDSWDKPGKVSSSHHVYFNHSCKVLFPCNVAYLQVL